MCTRCGRRIKRDSTFYCREKCGRVYCSYGCRVRDEGRHASECGGDEHNKLRNTSQMYLGGWWAEGTAIRQRGDPVPVAVIEIIEQFRWSMPPEKPTPEVDDVWGAVVWDSAMYIESAVRQLGALSRWVDGLVLMDCVEEWVGSGSRQAEMVARYQRALDTFKNGRKLIVCKQPFVDVSSHTNVAFRVIGTRCRHTLVWLSCDYIETTMSKEQLLNELDESGKTWLCHPLYWTRDCNATRFRAFSTKDGRPFLWTCPPTDGQGEHFLSSECRSRPFVATFGGHYRKCEFRPKHATHSWLPITERTQTRNCENLLLDTRSPNRGIAARAEFYSLYDFLNGHWRLPSDDDDEQTWKARAIGLIANQQHWGQERYTVAYLVVCKYGPTDSIHKLFDVVKAANAAWSQRRRINVVFAKTVLARVRRGENLDPHLPAFASWLSSSYHFSSIQTVEYGLFAEPGPVFAVTPFSSIVECLLLRHRVNAKFLELAYSLAKYVQYNVGGDHVGVFDTSVLLAPFISVFGPLADIAPLCAQYAQEEWLTFV